MSATPPDKQVVAMVVTPAVEIKPARSFKDWGLFALLVDNRDKIKVVIGALAGYLSTVISAIQNQALSALLGTVSGVVFYILACAVDYYFKARTTTPTAAPLIQ